MKKITFMAMLIALFMTIPVISFAEKPGEMKGSKMGERSMMSMCPIHGCMMKMIMSKTIIATEDGGVIVMSGNKLMKYDKNLSLTKEVAIKIDTEGMTEMMMEMKEKCSMCKKMMEEGSAMKK